MILRSVYQLYDILNTWQKERMKDTTIIAKNRKKEKHLYVFVQDTPDDRDTTYDDPLTYSEVAGYITKEVSDENDNHWQLRKILSVQYKPPNQKDCLGSEYNAMVLWETGDVTKEPLNSLTKDILPFPYFQEDVEMLLENGEITYEPLPFLAKDIFPAFYYEAYTGHLFEDDSFYFDCYTEIIHDDDDG